MKNKILNINYMSPIKQFLALVLIGCLMSACGGKTDSTNLSTVQENVDITTVKTISLEKKVISRTVDYTASISAYEELQVAPSAVGRIDELYVEVGDRVKKGDKLFLMDRTTYYQTKLQFASYATDLARLDTLLLTGSVTKQQYDQMKTQYDVAKSNLEYLEKNTLMEAPFDGIITGKYYEAGELYSGSPSALSGGKSAIVTLMQINPVKIVVSVSEQYLPLIKRGMKATVKADVYNDQIFEGRVALVYPTIDATTRTFQIELEVPNRNELLRPGMFARVSMDLGNQEAFAVPASVILMQEGTNTRYIFLENNGVVQRVNVQVGKRYDDLVEISASELSDGVAVVSEGQAKLTSGDKVKVVK